MSRTRSDLRRTARALAVLLAWLTCAPAFAIPDYAMLDDLLIAHVRDGFVDYDGIALDPRLADFLDQLAATAPAELQTPADRKAFYINAYNAIAIHGIVNGQSPESRWGRSRFFKRMRIDVLGEPMSLEDIEHGRLRKMGDARIHFAIVCASLSCPRLASRAYLPETLDTQLEAAADQFLNDPTRNVFDANRRVAYVSKIFDWFEEDFLAEAGSLQAYMARYVTDQASARVLRADGFDVNYRDYDWGLNGRYSR